MDYFLNEDSLLFHVDSLLCHDESVIYDDEFEYIWSYFYILIEDYALEPIYMWLA